MRNYFLTLLFTCLGLCQSAAGEELIEHRCSLMVYREGKPVLLSAPGLKILDYDDKTELKGFTGDDQVSGILCERSSVIPSKYDYQVVLSGYPFFIRDDRRFVGLDWKDGKYSLLLGDGPAFSQDELQQIEQRLHAYPAPPQLATNAPSDRAVGLTSKQYEKYEHAVQPLIAQARLSYPEAKRRYLAGLPPNHIFSVTTMLLDPNGKNERVFIVVHAIVEGRIYGKIASRIELVKGFHEGDAYDLPELEIDDWTISKPDGTEEGNLVGKFEDTYRPDAN